MTSASSVRPSGLELSGTKPSIRLQDDLFRFMNGGWLDANEIPADRSAYGSFHILRERSEERVRAIITDLSKEEHEPGSVAQKIGNLYRSFMDSERIEAEGISPIQSDLDLALSLADGSTVEDFLRAMGSMEARGGAGLFYIYISTDHMDSTVNLPYMGQSGLSLPDESYYREEEYEEVRQEFLGHVERMLSLAGIPDGAAHAQRILKLETEIAAHHWDQVKDRDATLTYNKKSFEEVKALSPHFNWELWMGAAEVPTHVLKNVVLRQPSFFEGISALLGSYDAVAWSSWLTWQTISGAAPYLHEALVNENFAFYGTVLSGTPQLKERWKRGVGLVEGGLGEAIGEIYVARHFPAAAKARMEELVANLIEAYRVDILALDWMSEATKKRAIEKLEKFTRKIGYPDKWRDYSALHFSADKLIENLNNMATFVQNREFAKIGRPVDRDEWLMFPQTVNAYYHPAMNEIVFPAAILQPPFFNLEADDAVNYGAIGAVIGHEIGHGFDDQGSKYDGDGMLNNWWEDSDRAKFQERADKLIEQFNALAPESTPDTYVNGALTIGENIGDLGGLTIALKAYELSLNGQEAPIIDGYTGIQRLFLGYAQAWRGKVRPEELKRRIATDPHSPEEFRCNQIVRNLDEFYEAFDVKPSDALYLEKSARVRIW